MTTTHEPTLADAVRIWQQLNRQREAVEDQMATAAAMVEASAHRLLSAERRLPRTGMYPTLVEIEGDRCRFAVTNGIDYDDDFSHSYTIGELEQDAEEVRHREAAERRQHELAKLRASQAHIATRIAELEAEA